jgi:hypothetical protein
MIKSQRPGRPHWVMRAGIHRWRGLPWGMESANEFVGEHQAAWEHDPAAQLSGDHALAAVPVIRRSCHS